MNAEACNVIPIRLTHDADAAIEFLAKLYPEGPWALSTISVEQDGLIGETFYPATSDTLRRWLTAHDDRNIYYSVNRMVRAHAKAAKTEILDASYLHVDVDPRAGESLPEEHARILALLSNPPSPIPRPSIAIASGGGINALWRLTAPVDIGGVIERAIEFERYNLKLEIALGGDHCHNVDRILRLPGSINRPNRKKQKKGRIEARASVLWCEDTTYSIDAFEKAAPIALPGPSSRAGNAIGNVRRLASVDDLPESVSPRTKALIVQGMDPDDAAKWSDRSAALFHVCCELARAGCADELIYAVITDPDFKISASVLDKGSSIERYALRQIDRARESVAATPLRIVLPTKAPLVIAERALAALGLDDLGRQTFARWAGAWWQWRDGHHREIDDEAIRGMLWRFVDRIDIEGLDDDGRPQRVPLVATKHHVNETEDALRSAIAPRLARKSTPPCAMPGYDGPPLDSLAVVRNGLLDLGTSELSPPTPLLFATSGAAVDYVPGATCPTWERFLVEIFTDHEGTDEETIRLLRQIFGWLVAGDTTRHKIPLLVGPPRSGKSTAMAILRSLLGEGNVCSPPLASLGDSRFGLAPLVGKSAAIIPDARLGSRADQDAIAQTLNAVSGQDPVTIDRKNRDAIEVRLRCRLVIVTNELPRIGDSSGALASRFLVVETRRSFLGAEDLELEGRLRGELPGVLLWAIAGWRDLVASGWAKPARAQATIEDLDRLGSPIKAFVSDRLVLERGCASPVAQVYQAWRSWCIENGRTYPGSEASFGRDLRAAIPGLQVRQVGGRGARVRAYEGIGLRTEHAAEEPF